MRTLIAAAAAVLLLTGAPLAAAHQGSPNMRSAVTAITPETDGITVTVLNNDDRHGDVKVPAGLGSEPKWKRLSGTGRFEWHDHRMHWMSRSKPPQVEDEDKRTHVFDWKVPITVAGAQGQIAGTLDWVPLPGGGLPTGLVWGTAIVLILLCAGVFALRRRRATAEPSEPAEAW